MALGTVEKLAVISYYVPPPSNGPDATALDPFLAAYPACLIVGDLNSKHQFYGCRSTDRAGEELFNFVESNDMLVLNSPDQATHYNHFTGSSDILDYVISTRTAAKKTTSCNTGEDVGSDHLPLIIHMSMNRMVDRLPTVMRRPLASCNWEAFGESLDNNIQHVAEQQLYLTHTIDKRCNEINSAITAALDVACPKRPVLQGAFRVKKETLKLIKDKRKLRRQYQSNKDSLLRTALNNMNNRVHRAIADEKRQAWHSATEELNSLEGAKLWKKFNNLTGTGKSSTNIRKLDLGNGATAAGDDEVATAFATHLEKAHQTHEGAEYCEENRNKVDNEIKSNPLLFMPCLPLSRNATTTTFWLKPFTQMTSALHSRKQKEKQHLASMRSPQPH